jgi:hypothetical protein
MNVPSACCCTTHILACCRAHLCLSSCKPVLHDRCNFSMLLSPCGVYAAQQSLLSVLLTCCPAILSFSTPAGLCYIPAGVASMVVSPLGGLLSDKAAHRFTTSPDLLSCCSAVLLFCCSAVLLSCCYAPPPHRCLCYIPAGVASIILSPSGVYAAQPSAVNPVLLTCCSAAVLITPQACATSLLVGQA